MKRFRPDSRHDRPNPRALRVAFGITAVGAALLLAACSSSSSSSTPPPPPRPSTSAAASTAPASNAATTGPDVAALNADVSKYAALPSFSDYVSDYGGKIPSVANLAGKKIMIIPGVSALAACTEIAQAVSGAAKAVGMVPTIFENQGATADHNAAIEDAIHQGYAAIAMGCALDPSTSAPAIAQAQKAGLVVSVYGGTPQQDQRAGTTYNTDDPYALDAKLAAEQAVAQHNGQPFDAIAITSYATGPATQIEEDRDPEHAGGGLPEVQADRGERRGAGLGDAGRQRHDLRAAQGPAGDRPVPRLRGRADLHAGGHPGRAPDQREDVPRLRRRHPVRPAADRPARARPSSRATSASPRRGPATCCSCRPSAAWRSCRRSPTPRPSARTGSSPRRTPTTF